MNSSFVLVIQYELLNVTKIVVWEKPNLRPILRYYYCKVHCCDLQICLEVLYKCMVCYCWHFKPGSFHSYIFDFLLQTYASPPYGAGHGALLQTQTWTFWMSHWSVNSSCSVATCLRFPVLLCSTFYCRTCHFGHRHFVYLTLCFKNSLSYVFLFFIIVLIDFLLHLFTT